MMDYVSIASLKSLLLLFVCVGLPIFVVWYLQRHRRQRVARLSDLWTERTTEGVIVECLELYDELMRLQREIVHAQPDYASRPDMVLLRQRLATAATALTNVPVTDPLRVLAQYETLLDVLGKDEVWVQALHAELCS